MLFHHLPAHVPPVAAVSSDRNVGQKTVSGGFSQVEKKSDVERHRPPDMLQAGVEAMMT
jgi:hypothetical protein